MSSGGAEWEDLKKPRELLVIDIETPNEAVHPKSPISSGSWEDQIFQHLQSLNIYSSITKLGGCLDSPCHTFRGTTSRAFKVYAITLCAISFAFTIQSLIYCFAPSLVPETYLVLTDGSGQIARYAKPIWSLATTILRVAMIKNLLDEDFSRHIRRVVWDIANEPLLAGHGIRACNLPLYLGAPSAFFIFFFLVFIYSSFIRYRLSLLDPVFYSLSCEAFLYHTSFEVIAWFLGLVTFKHVLPLLRVTNRRFLLAAETADANTLQEAIACHDKCWNLIKCIDRIGGYFVGVCLTVTVPTTVILASFLGTVSREPRSFYPFALWTICFFGSVGFLTYVTGSIQAVAHLPDEILTRKVYTCSQFKDNAFQFRARFANRSIGYTYFGFATFRKETLLTVLNLVATYVVVGFQLKSNSPPKPTLDQASPNDNSVDCVKAQL